VGLVVCWFCRQSRQDFTIPKGTDDVCLRSGRPYRWAGNPPKLTALVAADRREARTRILTGAA
jgi:hypothetical protein